MMKMVIGIDDQAETCKGTLSSAGSRNIPDVGGTERESECRVVEGVAEVGVVGGEGIPGEEGVGSVGMSAKVGAKMIAKKGFALLRANDDDTRKV